MTILLYAIAAVLAIMYITWTYYLAVMKLKLKRDELSIPAKIFGYPILWVGLLWDVLFNVVVGSLTFLEPPKELLFTARCNRHLQKLGWRQTVAMWWCSHFLDPFDEGGHCKVKK